MLNIIEMATGCLRRNFMGSRGDSRPEVMPKIPSYIVQVEDGREPKDGAPSQGPVFRSIYSTKDFPPQLPAGISTCWDFFRNAVLKYPNNPLLGQRKINEDGKAGEYVFATYEEVYYKVLSIGAAMRSLGVNSGHCCGIYGTNCPEWFMAMQACNGHSIYCVPLYDTLGEDAVEFIVKHAEISIVFVQSTKVSLLMKTLANCTAFVKTLVSFSTITREESATIEGLGIAVYTWAQLLTLGRKNPAALSVPNPKDICTIMYTSGTTGEPKGVRITNESLVDLVVTTESLFRSLNLKMDEKDTYFSFLPLAHIFDRAAEELFVYVGGKIGFWRGLRTMMDIINYIKLPMAHLTVMCDHIQDAKLLAEDVTELKPTLFLGVPRIFDRIYSGFREKLRKKGKMSEAIFNYAYKSKLLYMSKGYRQDRASPFFDKLVFNKVKAGLGGRLRLVLSGAAPLTPTCEEFLRTTLCAPVMQGYGLTETCAGSFMAIPDVISMKGTVGPPLPNVEVRLESIPELNYDALGVPSRGEICIRGKPVFHAYHKREELTKEVLIDGWFHTGDVGEWQPDGAMKIIDRKKNIFKLSQGEYIAVENLENVYAKCPVVEMIWVYGNSYESVLVAVVVPVRAELENWAKSRALTGAMCHVEELCQNRLAMDFVLTELAATAKLNKLRGFEVIKAVHLEPVPFNFERDFLTPTYKKKRPQLLRFYQGVVHELYQGLKS